MDYIDHFKNFNPKRHLNNSKLHLNKKGSRKLNNIFVSYLSDLFKWNNDISTNVNVSVNGNDESVSYENEERESHQAFPQIQIQNFGGTN